MSTVTKKPYYQLESSFFSGVKWKCYQGEQGCVAIDSPQSISMERPAPGKTLPSPSSDLPRLIAEKINLPSIERVPEQIQSQQRKPQQSKTLPNQNTENREAEHHQTIPVFDLQDIPGAMDKMGWTVSAKLARKWFAGPKHIWDDDLNSVQPIDDTTITSDWILKFRKAREKYDALLKSINNENSIETLRSKFHPIFEKIFHQSYVESFETHPDINDLPTFHKKWHFQHVQVSSIDTTEGILAFTDLTGSLANFNIYAAVGNVEVWGDKFYRYGEQTRFCFEPHARVTHVYIYIKDSYSFNDDKYLKKSQYLGHWNKNGLIVTSGGLISDFIDGMKLDNKKIHTDMGNSETSRYRFNLDNLMKNPLDKPIDKRTGLLKHLIEKDVYFPVYNKTYNQWRLKHDRGMDFMIYSKPIHIKLKNPIEFKMKTIFR